MVDATPQIGPTPPGGAGMQSGIQVPALSGAVDLYLDTLEAAGRAPGTVKEYRWVLRNLLRVSHGQIEACAVRDLLNACRSVNTKSTVLVVLRQWFKFLTGRGLLDTDPSAGIPMPRSRRRAYGLISEDQFQTLYNALQDPRMRVLVSTLYRTGSRVTETLLLRVEHVSFTDDGYGWLDLESRKGGEAGFAVFDHQLTEILKPWLVGRSGWVFPGKAGYHLGYGTAAERLAAAGREAGIPGRMTPHRLRHSFATRAVDEGWPQMALQTQLGHRDAASTARYYHGTRGGLIGFLRRQAVFAP